MSESMIDLMIMQVTQFDLTVKALYYTEVYN
jgi:hypothetical protein